MVGRGGREGVRPLPYRKKKEKSAPMLHTTGRATYTTKCRSQMLDCVFREPTVPADISRVVLARVSRHSRLVCLGLNVDNNDCDCKAAKQCCSHERAYWPFLSRGPKDRNRGVDFHPDIGSGVTRPLWWTQPSSGKMKALV